MLATLQELKDYLKISDTENDTKLSIVLQQADEYIKSMVERQLEYGTYTEKVRFLAGAGFLRETPIDTVNSITDLNGYTYTVYDLNKDSGFVMLDEKVDMIAEVEYTGGYQVIPNDLKMAVMRLAEFLFNNPEGVQNVNFEGITINYSDVQKLINSVIEKYKGVYI